MRFSQSFTLITVLGTLLFLSACGNTRELDENNVETATEVQEPALVEQRTVMGSYESVQGVMDKLSCYCSNGGYVTGADGVRHAVSFPDDAEVPSCDKITVTGYVTSKSIEANGACSAGMMGFLKVNTYTIGETDY